MPLELELSVRKNEREGFRVSKVEISEDAYEVMKKIAKLETAFYLLESIYYDGEGEVIALSRSLGLVIDAISELKSNIEVI